MCASRRWGLEKWSGDGGSGGFQGESYSTGRAWPRGRWISKPLRTGARWQASRFIKVHVAVANRQAARKTVARELAPVGARSGPETVCAGFATAAQSNGSKLPRHRFFGVSAAPRIALAPAKPCFLALTEKCLVSHDWLARGFDRHERYVIIVIGNTHH